MFMLMSEIMRISSNLMEIEPKNSHSYLWSIIHKEEEGDDKLFE